jgi:hypothetical protein
MNTSKDDLIARLRELYKQYDYAWHCDWAREAADEIERLSCAHTDRQIARLRAALKRIADAWRLPSNEISQMARLTLSADETMATVDAAIESEQFAGTGRQNLIEEMRLYANGPYERLLNQAADQLERHHKSLADLLTIVGTGVCPPHLTPTQLRMIDHAKYNLAEISAPETKP